MFSETYRLVYARHSILAPLGVGHVPTGALVSMKRYFKKQTLFSSRRDATFSSAGAPAGQWPVANRCSRLDETILFFENSLLVQTRAHFSVGRDSAGAGAGAKVVVSSRRDATLFRNRSFHRGHTLFSPPGG